MTFSAISSTFLIFIPLILKDIVTVEASWGTGSSRLQDLKDSASEQIQEMVQDKEHMLDDLDEEVLYTEKELNHMTQDELAFIYFTTHDTDGNSGLDGLELFKAIYHKHHHEHQDQEDVYNKSFDDSIELIDILLQSYDINNDGILDFTEFMISYTNHQNQL